MAAIGDLVVVRGADLTHRDVEDPLRTVQSKGVIQEAVLVHKFGFQTESKLHQLQFLKIQIKQKQKKK